MKRLFKSILLSFHLDKQASEGTCRPVSVKGLDSSEFCPGCQEVHLDSWPSPSAWPPPLPIIIRIFGVSKWSPAVSYSLPSSSEPWQPSSPETCTLMPWTTPDGTHLQERGDGHTSAPAEIDAFLHVCSSPSLWPDLSRSLHCPHNLLAPLVLFEVGPLLRYCGRQALLRRRTGPE